jgi:hypothetical protein
VAQNRPVIPFLFWGSQEGYPVMTPSLHSNQTILEIAQAAHLTTAIESFLVDRRAAGLTGQSVKFYRQNLQSFHTYCNDNAVKLVQEITAVFQRDGYADLEDLQIMRMYLAQNNTDTPAARWITGCEALPVLWRDTGTRHPKRHQAIFGTSYGIPYRISRVCIGHSAYWSLPAEHSVS